MKEKGEGVLGYLFFKRRTKYGKKNIEKILLNAKRFGEYRSPSFFGFAFGFQSLK